MILAESPSFADTPTQSDRIVLSSFITAPLGAAITELTREDLDTITDAAQYLPSTPFTLGLTQSADNFASFIQGLEQNVVVAVNTGPTHEFHFEPAEPPPLINGSVIFIGGEYAEVVKSALNHHLNNTAAGIRGYAEMIQRRPTDMSEEMDATIIFDATEHLLEETAPLLSAEAYTVTMLPNQPVHITPHPKQEAA